MTGKQITNARTLLDRLQSPILPQECLQVEPKHYPPLIVRDELGKDQRKWHMWGRVCDRLEESNQVAACDLVYEGWVAETITHRFLRWLSMRDILRPDGIIHQSTSRGMVEFTVYRKGPRFLSS